MQRPEMGQIAELEVAVLPVVGMSHSAAATGAALRDLVLVCSAAATGVGRLGAVKAFGARDSSFPMQA